ncbi:MAG: hypothetical protein JMDDDDMK_02964 [Acidobacteria bacterium]|nr:hypothetical protein [Acidobacteriota bacterium]
MQRRAQDGAHLRSENLVNSQRESDRAQPQRRVAFGFESVQMQFVAAQIECADDRAIFAAGVGQEFVGLVLLLFSRQPRSRLGIKKLRAVQPDARGVEPLQGLDLFNQFDVRAQFDFAPVACDGRQFAFFDVMKLLGLLALTKLDVKTHSFGQRVDDDRARRAVNDDRFAGTNAPGDVAHADYGWNVDAARDDRSVRSPSARARDEAQHAARIEIGGDRRQQIVGDDDRICGQFVQVARLRARKDFDQTMGHVGHVRAAFTQVIVGDLGVNVQQVIRRVAHGPFGVDAVLADAVFDLASQVAVFEHHQVSFENVGAFGAEDLLEAAHRLMNLALGGADGFAEPFDLGLDLMFRDEHPHDAPARIVNQKDRSNRNALTNAYALVSEFSSFPS